MARRRKTSARKITPLWATLLAAVALAILQQNGKPVPTDGQLVSVIVAPIIVNYHNDYTPLGKTGWVFVIIMLAILSWAILRSKTPAKDFTRKE